MLRCVAKHLGNLRKEVVFMGGTVLPFLMTDAVTWNQRRSKDIDFIVNFSTKNDIYEFEDKLWDLGFKRRTIGPVYHWVIDNVEVDVVPTDPAVVGFNNQWSMEAVLYAQQVYLDEDLAINIINSPYYLAVKFAAFAKRGKNNYMKSYDIADIVRIMYGDKYIEKNIQKRASDRLRSFLRAEFNKLLNSNYKEIIVNYLPKFYRASGELSIVEARIKKVAGTI